MSNKFFNDAVIGNKNVRATFSSTGELLRAYPRGEESGPPAKVPK